MGITASTSAIEVTRNIGKYEGSASYDREENVASVGLDIGIAGVGVTTDHGGAITAKIELGIVGMEVEWGAEGGIVDTQAGFGLFEVKVEAKNCVVTERKLIAGQVVATRTYPDPGCKLPEPPIPEPPIPGTAPGEDPAGVEVPDTDIRGWVFVNISFRSNGQGGEQSSRFLREITSPIKERLPAYVGRAPVDMKAQTPNSPIEYMSVTKNVTTLWVHRIPVYDTVGWIKREVPLHTELASQQASSIYFTSDDSPLFFWGSFRDIRKFLKVRNSQNEAIIAYTPSNYQIVEFIPYACIPFYGEVKELPFLPTGNTPPMNNDCCE